MKASPIQLHYFITMDYLVVLTERPHDIELDLPVESGATTFRTPEERVKNRQESTGKRLRVMLRCYGSWEGK